jgi:hypothetical protein
LLFLQVFGEKILKKRCVNIVKIWITWEAHKVPGAILRKEEDEIMLSFRNFYLLSELLSVCELDRMVN